MSAKVTRHAVLVLTTIFFICFVELGHADESAGKPFIGSASVSVSFLAPQKEESIRKGTTYRLRWRCLGKCQNMRIHVFKEVCHQRCVPVYRDGRLIKVSCTRRICRPSAVTQYKVSAIRRLPGSWYWDWRVPGSWSNGKYLVLIEPSSNPRIDSLNRYRQILSNEIGGDISPRFELTD
jgi:hypothetical protein